MTTTVNGVALTGASARMKPPAGRFLLVELEPDLAIHRTTVNGVFASIKCVSGIRTIADLAYVSAKTLRTMTLGLEPPRRQRSTVSQGTEER